MTMSRRFVIPSLAFALMLLVGIGSRAQDKDKDKDSGKPKDPESKYALDVLARKAGQGDFQEGDVKRYAIEVYQDGPTSSGLFLTETSAVGAVPAKLFKGGDGKGQAPLFLYGLVMTSRPVGEKEFEKGKKSGVEVYKDEVGGGLAYVTEQGGVSVLPAKYVANATPSKEKPKAPTWKHAMELKVRKVGEVNWTKDTKKIALEVYRDEVNQALIYLTDKGNIAVVPSKLTTSDDKGKEIKWQHGLELDVRKVGESEFTKDTKKYSMEVFQDGNNGNMIYLTEGGSVSVVPGKFAKLTEGKNKAPEWKHGLEVKVRKVRQTKFSKDDKKVSAEVYVDSNNGNLIFITDTGEIAVVAPNAE